MTPAVIEPPAVLYGLNPQTQKPYKTRMGTATDARQLVQKTVIEDKDRSRLRALTKAMWAGASPYNEATRKTEGLGWSANLNLMSCEAAIDSARIPYYALSSTVKEVAVITTKFKPTDPDNARWGQCISKRYNDMIRAWPEYNWHMQQHQFWMLFEGYAPVIRDDDTSWKFRSLDSAAVKVPKDSPSCLDKRIPFVVVRVTYRVHELWEKIQNAGSAADIGWKLPAVKRAIMQASKGIANDTSWSLAPWEEWERRLQNHDLSTSYTAADEIKCAWIYVKEMGGGKISRFLVTETEVFDDNPRAAETKNSDAGFLFKHVSQYASYDEALIVFFQNTGDGTWHSVRGMAMKGFKHWDCENRLKCKALDNAFQRASIVLKSETALSADKMKLMVRSDYTMLPPNTDIVNAGFAGDIEGVMAVDRMLSNHLANNLGVYNQRTISREDGRGEQPTATQVNAQSNKEAQLTNGQIDNYYLTSDTLHDQTVRIAKKGLDPESKAFRDGCREDGVPDEAFDHLCVKANRASGYGSAQMRQMVLQQIQTVYPSLPPEGQQAFLDMWISATAGVDKIDSLNPKQHFPTNDDWQATVENGIMDGGSPPPPVVSGQDPTVHLAIHIQHAGEQLAPIEQALESEEPVDPAALQAAAQLIGLMAPHCEEHLAPMEADPTRKGAAKMFRQQLMAMVAFDGKLRAAIFEAQREAQLAEAEAAQAQALGALDQQKLASAQLADQLKIDKWQTDKAVKIDKARLNSQTKVASTVQTLRLNDLKTASSTRLEALKTRHQIQLENAKANKE